MLAGEHGKLRGLHTHQVLTLRIDGEDHISSFYDAARCFVVECGGDLAGGIARPLMFWVCDGSRPLLF
jgi:hypothetical protein